MAIFPRTATFLVASLAPQAWAHGGHGMPGATHWHASDVAGLALVVAGSLVAWWLSGGEE